ncbi:MAG: alanyl-tRNA editing protein, partial [Candidatus Polarisedimenticolia bacterium]
EAPLAAGEAPLAAGEAPRAGDTVEGAIDWGRRFDHMQQHSGQHILSRAFLRDAAAATRSFHLGEMVCTIDLDLAAPEEALMRRAEATANEVIAANAAVRVTLRPVGEAPSGPSLRPGEAMRMVAVGDFDETPCGGTHVTASGQVGAVLVRSWEKFKGGTRVTFLCGGRVVAEAARLAGLLDRCSARLSVPAAEVPSAIERLQDQLGEARRAARLHAEAMAALECEALDREASQAGAWRVVTKAWPDRAVDDLQRLAQAYVAGAAGRAALLATLDAGGKASLVFARSACEDPAAPRMGDVLAAVCRLHGGKGGGGAALARGGGVPGGAVSEALAEACRLLQGSAAS